MPTNLPPDYFQVEQQYRSASSIEEKIALLEEMISIVPQHKGTDKMRGDLRRRLSKLRTASQTGRRASRRESAFHVDRQGAAQAVVIGPTNVGKSALVAALTNATPEVAEYPYTTWRSIPGMMPVKDIQIQLIDTPPMNRDYVQPELINLIRGSDLILLVVDLQTDPIQQLEDTIAILVEHHIVPRHLQDRYGQQRRLTSIPLMVLVNKNDEESTDEDVDVLRELLGDDWPLFPVSGATGRNLERLKQALFERLEIIRVYSKPPGEDADLTVPFSMKKGGTVGEFAGKVHQDSVEKLKSARVWGSGVHDGQIVSREHVLDDGDIVELRI